MSIQFGVKDWHKDDHNDRLESVGADLAAMLACALYELQQDDYERINDC